MFGSFCSFKFGLKPAPFIEIQVRFTKIRALFNTIQVFDRLLCGGEGGGSVVGGRFFSHGQSGESEDGDVVFLTEFNGDVGRLRGRWIGGEERLEPVEAIQLA